MQQPPTLSDRGIRKDFVSVNRTRLRVTRQVTLSGNPPSLQQHRSFRAARIVDDPTRFVIVSVDKKAELRREQLLDIIDNGLRCGNQTYAWLGFTESHLKSNQFLVFREDSQWTVQKLLSLLGDLPSVFQKSGYGKYAARLGLSFSSTSVAIKIPSAQMICMPDKRAEDDSLTTDGIGMMRESLANEIRTRLSIREDTSAFQCRFGGIKGMLVSYPDEDFDRLAGYPGKHINIVYRDSMLKYPSNLDELEICGVSRSAGRSRLCVQFILLLLTLGTPLQTFEELLKEQIEDISLFMHDRSKAIEILELTDSVELDAEGQGFYQEVYEMLLAGHDLNEPYFRFKMEQFQRQRYKNLHDKLAIDVKNSARVYGVVDEYGVLKEDEVYINMPNRMGVFMGRVAVTRNPAYASGDIRVLNAVNKPELAHLKNCIVFPSKCRRSVPDTMGGGDLDGDQYWVTWDLRLIPPTVDPPLDRTAGPAADPMVPRTRATMRVDAAETFVQLRDSGRGVLGILCKEWEKVTKTSHGYARSPRSEALVPLIEEAMDMLKKGSDPAALRGKHVTVQRKTMNSGEAPDPLEHLRRIIPRGGEPKMPHWIPDPELDIREEYLRDWDDYYREASSMCNQFGKELRRGIFEDERDQDGDSLQSGESGLEKHADRVKRVWQEEYLSAKSAMDHLRVYARASAWYIYGYEKQKKAFAWLGARYLNMLKAGATNYGRLPLPVGNCRRPLAPSDFNRDTSCSSPSASQNEPPSSSTPRFQPSTSSCPTMDREPDIRAGSTRPFQFTSGPSSSTSPPSSCSANPRPETRRHAKPPPSCPNPSFRYAKPEPDRHATPPPSASTSRRPEPQSYSRPPPSSSIPTSSQTDARTNPKPSRPVATQPSQISSCARGQYHEWHCNWANGTMRRYGCKIPGCTVQVKEKKVGWVWTFSSFG